MKRIVPILMIALLLVVIWRVYAVRSQLATGDADPAQLAKLKSNLSHLATTLADGEYRGRPYEIDAKTIRNAGADAYGSIQYLDAAGNIYRVYVGGAVANAENFHAPSYCLPAGGWEVLDDSVRSFDGDGAPDLRMRRLALQRNQERMVVYYWFQAGARTTPDEFMVRFYRFLDLLMGQPFRPTMIVSVYVPAQDDIKRADERGQEFLRALRPSLLLATTDEKDTQ